MGGFWVFVALAAPFVAGEVRAGAAEYLLPPNGDNVIGVVTTAVAEHEDTLLDIGRRYGVGYEEIIAANPGIDPWLPGAGTEVLIPSRFVIPAPPARASSSTCPSTGCTTFRRSSRASRASCAPTRSARARWTGRRPWA